MMERLLLGLLLASLCGAQVTTTRLNRIVQAYVDKHQFMGSVLVARGNTILLNRGYGSANLEWNIPNSPIAKFRLGSLRSSLRLPAYYY